MKNDETPATSLTRYGFIGTVLWSLAIFAMYTVTQILSAAVYGALRYGGNFENELSKLVHDGNLLAFSAFLSLVIAGLLILLAIKLKNNASFSHYLGLKTPSFSDTKNWLIILVFFIIISDVITNLLGKPIVPDVVVSAYNNTNNKWAFFAVIIIAAPIFEELFFRGFFLSGLKNSFVKPSGAIIISAAIWAAIHIQYDLYTIFIIFILGIILGIAYLKTGSLFLVMVLHTTVNIIASIQTVVFSST